MQYEIISSLALFQQIQGERGDKYVVSIGTNPTCNCPAFTRQMTSKLKVATFDWCKHILFLMSRKLGWKWDSACIHQKALTQVKRYT